MGNVLARYLQSCAVAFYAQVGSVHGLLDFTNTSIAFLHIWSAHRSTLKWLQASHLLGLSSLLSTELTHSLESMWGAIYFQFWAGRWQFLKCWVSHLLFVNYVAHTLETTACTHAKFPTLCDTTDCSPQAPLSLRFSRQEYWSGWPCPSGEFPHSGTEPEFLFFKIIIIFLL